MYSVLIWRFSKKVMYRDRKIESGFTMFSKYSIKYRTRITEVVPFFLERLCHMLEIANIFK